MHLTIFLPARSIAKSNEEDICPKLDEGFPRTVFCVLLDEMKLEPLWSGSFVMKSNVSTDGGVNSRTFCASLENSSRLRLSVPVLFCL